MPEEQNFAAIYQEPRLQLAVQTLVDKNAAVAEVLYTRRTYRDFGREVATVTVFTETGSSKRDKGDPFDRDLGEQFAVARALVKLGKAIERDAAKQVARLTPAQDASAPFVTLDQVLTEATRRDSLDHNPPGHVDLTRTSGRPWWWRA